MADKVLKMYREDRNVQEIIERMYPPTKASVMNCIEVLEQWQKK